MKQIIQKIIFNTQPFQIIDITKNINKILKNTNIQIGLLNLSVLHTSCSLMIQENADNSVMLDIKNFLDKIAPDDDYYHNSEGSDDMPAHLKSLLTQTNLTVSVRKNILILGTWQGIFLLEHRNANKRREVFFHLIGD